MILPLQDAPLSRPERSAQAPADPLYLVDGHSLTFKAYYAIRGLTAPDGSPTGAVYGFLRMLLRLIEEKKAKYLAVIFDTGEPTFREDLYKEYKANREAPPPDFGQQMKWIYDLLGAMGIAVYQMKGFEADDLIATMARQMESRGAESVIVSADKDLFQLVDARTRFLRFGQQDMELYDVAGVENFLGIAPSQVPDWLAIVGDSSDNIPGVPTIGAKGAVKFLQQYGSLETLIARAGELKNERQRAALIENAEQARLSRRLATVVSDVPFGWSLEQCHLPDNLWNEHSIALVAALGFNSLIREKGLKVAADARSAPAAVQPARPQISTQYRIVSNAGELEAWVEGVRQARWVGLDTETDGINPMTAHLVGISMSCRPGEAIYIPVSHRIGEGANRQIPLKQLREILNPLLGAEPGRGAALTAHNSKFDWKILERAGFKLAAPKFDTMLASFVLDPGRLSGHGLKTLGSELLGIQMKSIGEIIGEGKNSLTMDQVVIEEVYEYACADADVTLRLTECLEAKLNEHPTLRKLFDEIEIPLIPVLHKMESGGFAVDPDALRRLSQVMSRELEDLGRKIWKEAGRQFNIESPKQVAQVLFDELGLPPGKKTKTGYSTDTDVLESLQKAHPIVNLILEYRGITKLKSTYADALPVQVNPQTLRIHTSFNQTIAQTGRLSSTNPNLQNIPIRSALGKEIRRAFIPDAPGHRLLSADYSQIELRILAHFSGDAALCRAYASGKDIHALTASRVFGVGEDNVTPDMRAQAKVINFGIIYGMSAHGLAQRLQIPRGDAAKFIEAYFGGYPGVKDWIEKTLERARKDGYVETLKGRRRWLPELTAKNGQLRANAERIAVNTPIQGTSADMIKLAMIDLDKGLGAAAPGGRMICQVHDELIFSMPEEVIEPATPYIRRTMADALPLHVPVVVDISVGKNWAEC